MSDRITANGDQTYFDAKIVAKGGIWAAIEALEEREEKHLEIPDVPVGAAILLGLTSIAGAIAYGGTLVAQQLRAGLEHGADVLGEKIEDAARDISYEIAHQGE